MVGILRKTVLVSFFTVSLFAKADFVLQEQCTYQNEQFWIKILYLCQEGDIACDRIAYIGLNKNDGEYIMLKGKTLLDENMNFKGYSFADDVYKYDILRNNLLYISKNDKIIREIELEVCK